MTATDYAAHGYGVFAVVRGGKAPATKNGLKDATTEPEIISRWCERYNVGLLPPARVLVLDADSPEVTARLERDYPELLDSPRCNTPSGGAHFYTRLPDGAAPPKTTIKVQGRSLDVRGLGKAYLVAPPSSVPAGSYTWARPLVSPDDLPETPAGVLELLTTKPTPPPRAPSTARNLPTTGNRYAHAALQAEHDRVATAVDGTRNDALNRAAFSLGQLVGSGALDRAEVEDALRGASGACGLDARETETTLKSGLEAGIAAPRDLTTSRPFDELPCSSNKNPWSSQKTDLTNTSRTQIGTGWTNAKSPWGN